MENDFYSKVCVARSFRFVVDEDEASRKSTDLHANDRFSCSLATILARDTEVVAVRLKILSNSCIIYISKNGEWDEMDNEYIRKIERYLRSISNNAPMTLKKALVRDDVRALFKDVMVYCSVKFESRFEKLKNYMAYNQHEQYIISFKSFMSGESIDVDNIDNVKRTVISTVCCEYYNKVKASTIPEDFLRHIKKVGSYVGSLIYIIRCMCKELFKVPISHLELLKLNPIRTHQTISSWSSIVRKFFTDEKFEDFKHACLNDYITVQNLKKIYGGVNSQMDSEVTQDVCLHAEMNILTNIIDQKDRSRVFIAVSKNCCYLCELYIKFAREQGYNIVISGSHKKICHAWKLPDIKDSTFWINSLGYMISSLNQIIGKEVKRRTILLADEGSSFDPDDFDLLYDMIKVDFYSPY